MPDRKLSSEDLDAIVAAGRSSSSYGARLRTLPGLSIGSVRARLNAGAETIISRVRAIASTRSGRRNAGVLAACLLLAAGAGAYLALRASPVPDYADDPMDDVLDFTLLTEDFNKLPLETRLELTKQLIERMKSMSSEDSMLLAAFAGSLVEKTRRQLEINAARLMSDVVLVHASGYADVPDDKKGEYLDNAFEEMMGLMQGLTGEEARQTPGETLARVKDQAKQEAAQMRSSLSPMRRDNANRMAAFAMDRGKDAVSDPKQRGQMTRFLRDMTRRLRGQDPATGKPEAPKPDPGPR